MAEINIYRIVHVATGRCYVGQTKDTARRFATHRKDLASGKHHSHFLQRAWHKYGEDAFVFEVIERCDESVAVAREQHFVDTLGAAFNVARTVDRPNPPWGNQSTRGRVMPEDEKRARSVALLGRPRPAEVREKIAAGNKGISRGKGHPTSEATGRRISAALKRRTRTPEEQAAITAGIRRAAAQISATNTATKLRNNSLRRQFWLIFGDGRAPAAA